MNSVDDCADSAPPKEADVRGLASRLSSSRLKKHAAQIVYVISGEIEERYNKWMHSLEETKPGLYSVLTCFIPVADKKEYHH